MPCKSPIALPDVRSDDIAEFEPRCHRCSETADRVDELVFNGEAVVVNIGSAQILGQFSLQDDVMVIELAQIDGGGEGVLPAIGSLASKLAKQRDIRGIEWQVHAVTCAQPNLKLHKMLVRRGFEIRKVDGIGEVYHQVSTVGSD